MNKVCIKCNKSKPVGDFHKQCSTKDGYNSSCKACRKIQQQAYRKSDKGRAKDKRYNDSSKRYTCLYRYWENNLDKKQCQTKLSNALRAGVLVNPHVCENCGNTSSVEGHHWKYSKENALDVIWICKFCHEREHELINERGYRESRGLYLDD